jgi:hypothetical protein
MTRFIRRSLPKSPALESLALTLGMLFLGFGGSLQAQPWSGIIDPSRAIDWSQAGVTGGIPARNTVCSTLGTAGQSSSYVQSVSGGQINSAMSSCPSGQVVYLNAGTYNISDSGINMVSNVTLRGAGANQTLLVFSGYGYSCAPVCFMGDNTYSSASQAQPGGAQTATWTGGFSQGATQITLNSIGSSGLSVGQYIFLDQANVGSSTGNVFYCDNQTFPCSLQGGNGGRVINGTMHGLVQIVKITACSPACTNGATFTISPGLYTANWSAANAPGAWWSARQLQYAGLENLSVDDSPQADYGQNNISIYNSFNCWVSGVRSVSAGRSHIQYGEAAHNTVQNSYIFGTKTATSQSYGVESYLSSDNLTVNNIFQQSTSPLMTQLATGNVFLYNFDILDFYCDPAGCNDGSTGNNGNLGETTWSHNAGQALNLWEGNITPGYKSDVLHGTGGLQTAFRNYIQGWAPYSTRGLTAVVLESYNRAYNFVGNVLGVPGHADTYQSGGNDPIFGYGYGNSESGVTVANDPGVGTTMFRWGNYDVVTGAARWCGNSSSPGWSTTCASTSEVPTSIGSYSNAMPTSTSLPASLYYSSTPGWWPSGKAWPPIGPDVNGGNVGICSGGSHAGWVASSSSQCSGGTLSSSLAGHVNSNPAMDCYYNVMNGPSDGTGSVRSFNASSCYGGNQVTQNPPPPPPPPTVAPPTVLKAVVQ